MSVTLERLRPADDSAAGIAGALDRIDAQEAAIKAQMISLQEERGSTLLSGTAGEVLEVETRSREASVQIEQLDLLRKTLQPKLVAAQAGDVIAAFAVKTSETLRLIERANAWWHDEYPSLAGAIRDGMTLIYQAEYGVWELQNAAIKADSQPGVKEAGGACVTLPPMPQTHVYPYGNISPRRATQLPRSATSADPFWWPRDLFGRLRRPQGQ